MLTCACTLAWGASIAAAEENVLVGGFFAILGYIAAYTSTKVGERKADDRKLAKPELYFWSRVMSYYPVHFLVSTIFLPMFVAIDEWCAVGVSSEGGVQIPQLS